MSEYTGMQNHKVSELREPVSFSERVCPCFYSETDADACFLAQLLYSPCLVLALS